MPRRCLNTVQRRKVQPATVPDASRVAGAGKVRLDELLTETITGEWGGESSPSKGVAVLRTTNFTNCGEINYDNLAWREIAKDKVERKHLCVGDIVVEKSGGTKDHPVGRVVFFDRADGLYLCNNFTQILRPDRNLIVPRFLFYTLRAKYEMRVTESMYNKTTGIQNLKMSLYMAMPVTLPPLSTQQSIADELDQLCALKKNAEDRLAILDQIVKSRFVEMFGRVKEIKPVALNAVSEISSGLTKNSKREKLPLRYRYLRVANVFFNKLDLTDVAEIGVEEKEIEKNLLAKNDLLFVEGNGSKEQIGRVAIWDGSIEPCLHQNHLIKARFNGTVIPEYALHYFMSQDGRTQILEAAVSTSGLHTLSTGKISKFKLPLPPLSLQREFAAFVAEVDKSELTLRETVATLDQLYRAKLQEHFG